MRTRVCIMRTPPHNPCRRAQRGLLELPNGCLCMYARARMKCINVRAHSIYIHAYHTHTNTHGISRRYGARLQSVLNGSSPARVARFPVQRVNQHTHSYTTPPHSVLHRCSLYLSLARSLSLCQRFMIILYTRAHCIRRTLHTRIWSHITGIETRASAPDRFQYTHTAHIACKKVTIY